MSKTFNSLHSEIATKDNEIASLNARLEAAKPKPKKAPVKPKNLNGQFVSLSDVRDVQASMVEQEVEEAPRRTSSRAKQRTRRAVEADEQGSD